MGFCLSGVARSSVPGLFEASLQREFLALLARVVSSFSRVKFVSFQLLTCLFVCGMGFYLPASLSLSFLREFLVSGNLLCRISLLARGIISWFFFCEVKISWFLTLHHLLRLLG